MAWKYENRPAGFYVCGCPVDRSIVHLTGTKKGIKYNRIMTQGGRPTSTTDNGFYTLMWNCVDLEDDPNFPYVYCATVADVQTQFAHDPDILTMIETWDQ